MPLPAPGLAYLFTIAIKYLRLVALGSDITSIDIHELMDLQSGAWVIPVG
jgi:hypothetical protein